MSRCDVDGHGLHTAGSVESRETDAHREDAFSVAGGLVLLARDHEGIIVLEQLQPPHFVGGVYPNFAPATNWHKGTLDVD